MDIRNTLYGTSSKSGGAWLGFHVALAGGKRPVLSTIGWFIGAGMGIAAILDVVSLAKRACGTHP